MYKKQLINSCSTLFGQAKRTNLLHYLRRRRESLSICAFDHTVPHAHRDRTASRLEVGTNQAKAWSISRPIQGALKLDLVEKPTIRPIYPARDFDHKKRHVVILLYIFSLHTAGSISAVDRAAAVYISPCVCGVLPLIIIIIYMCTSV